MGITLRHDAAAILPPSNKAGRKYGQQLVMQDRQNRQRDKDRLYDAQRQMGQNQFNILRDGLRDQAAIDRMNARGKVEQDQWEMRRKMQMADAEKMRQQELEQMEIQRARQNLDAIARDRLESGSLPDEVAMELRKTMAAKTAAMADPGYDATWRDEIRNKFNSQIANYLSQSKPVLSDQEQYDSVPTAVDKNTGITYRKVGPGPHDWAPIEMPEPQPMPQAPPTTQQMFQADQKLKDTYAKHAMNEWESNEANLGKKPPSYVDMVKRGMEIYDAEQAVYAPPESPAHAAGQLMNDPNYTPGSSPMAIDAVRNGQQQPLQQQWAPPSAPSTQPAPAQVQTPPPNNASQPAPEGFLPPAGMSQVPPANSPAAIANQMMDNPLAAQAGHVPSSMAHQGGVSPSGGIGPSVTQQQWREVAAEATPDSRLNTDAPSPVPGFSNPSKVPAGNTRPDVEKEALAPIGRPTPKPDPAPQEFNWDDQIKQAKKGTDRKVLKRLKTAIGEGTDPSVKMAITVLSDQSKSEEERMEAVRYVISQGYDLSRLIDPVRPKNKFNVMPRGRKF